MDLMYINKMSVSEDLRLMFVTLRAIFKSESTEGIDKDATTAMKPGVSSVGQPEEAEA